MAFVLRSPDTDSSELLIDFRMSDSNMGDLVDKATMVRGDVKIGKGNSGRSKVSMM